MQQYWEKRMRNIALLLACQYQKYWKKKDLQYLQCYKNTNVMLFKILYSLFLAKEGLFHVKNSKKLFLKPCKTCTI